MFILFIIFVVLIYFTYNNYFTFIFAVLHTYFRTIKLNRLMTYLDFKATASYTQLTN